MAEDAGSEVRVKRVKSEELQMAENDSKVTRRNVKSLYWRLVLCLMPTRKVF